MRFVNSRGGSWSNFPTRFSIFQWQILGGSNQQGAGSHGGVQKFWGGPIRVPWGGPIGGPMLKSQKLGGSNVPIPKVGGVRTPPTRAVAAPMRIVMKIFLRPFPLMKFGGSREWTDQGFTFSPVWFGLSRSFLWINRYWQENDESDHVST